MADEAQVLTGYFKGVRLAIDGGSVSGGRKVAVKQFPGRDTQSVEDLGLIPRKYSLDIIISDKPDQDYFAYRRSLLAALESKGPGELIHPIYGRISGVVAVTYNLNETFDNFGVSVVSVNFEINDNTGIPQSSGSAITEVVGANKAVQAAVNEDIANSVEVTPGFTGNFTAAVDKVEAIIEAARESTAFIGESAVTLNQFSAELGELSASVNSLVTDPIALANGITGLFASVNGLYQSAGATFETALGFFGFGDSDDPIPTDTAGRVQRANNAAVLNASVAASALGYAYQAATRVDFETTLDIDDLTARLDDQYEAVLNSAASQDVRDAVTDMRIKVLAALDEIRIDTSQIIEVYTHRTTARLLSFAYYDDDSQADTIIRINNLSDVSFVEGTVQVVTE